MTPFDDNTADVLAGLREPMHISRSCPPECNGNSGMEDKYMDALAQIDGYKRALRIMAETSITAKRSRHSEAYYQRRIEAATEQARKEKP